jgi:hypothetical protein
MSTSGTTSFSRNRDQLIESALRKINAFESGETPDSDSISDASDALNAMLKHWQASGIHIWRTTEAILFPQLSQVRYVLGASTDHATESYVETALTSAAALGASTVVLDSVTGVATTYKIGVQLDDGTIQWTTVNGAPSGSTVTLTAVLTDSAALGNRVLVYQTDLTRPLKVLDARRYNFDSAIDTPLGEMDRIEYQEMPNKTATGAVNGFYYDRRGGANTTGYLYLWPSPATVDEAIKLTIARPIEIFSVAGNDADFPDEWTQAIVWNLADQLADDYEVPEPKRTRIERRAAQYLAEANWNEKELVSFELVPDR